MPLKVLFYGTPQFAVPTLQKLLESQHQVVGVVTQPDKPAGRGHRLTAPPVKELALQHNIPVFQFTALKKPETLAALAALSPDVAVVVAYGRILPKALLDLPRHGSLNIHGSLLPAYRGAAPIQWAIIRGEKETGISIMQMDEGLDTGPVICKEVLPILEDDDTVSLGNMLSYMGADLMVRTLDQLEVEGSLESIPQDSAAATLAPLIERDMARIDWEKPPEAVLCHIRGFQPWPKAFTTLGNNELKITGADACDPQWLPESAFDERIDPGTVVDIFKGRGIVVRTGGKNGAVLITRVQPPGKPEMGGFDFFNGGGLDVGTRLGGR